jgi:hypothetical protein
VINLTLWLLLFGITYLLLLPLGGYRSYRPLIVRHDTFSPITLTLIFTFGLTSIFVLKNLKRKFIAYYSVILLTMIFIFENADRYNGWDNLCEKGLLYTIAKSKEDMVLLEDQCIILCWSKSTNPADSENAGRMMQFWNVTDRKKLYYYTSSSW